jgi:hypothetical protein
MGSSIEGINLGAAPVPKIDHAALIVGGEAYHGNDG